MLTIEKVDTASKSQVRRFVRIPYRLYKGNPYWVPALFIDAEIMLNRQKHPFYEHSDADFFIAVRNGRDVGRIAALVNKPYNQYHNARKAQFFLFECEDDNEAARLLFESVATWAKERDLDTIVGPKGFGVVDGYGLLVEGFDHRAVMTMTSYNFNYYPRLVEAAGYEKEVDFISCYLSADSFNLPERIHSIAHRVQDRGSLKVKRFQSKKEIKAWAGKIGKTYNQAFVNNWEYYPLTDNEIAFLLANLMSIANPRLIKVITHDEDVVGFLFGFPDLSSGLQRAAGHLLPFGLAHILLDMRRTNWVAINGAGILPEFQGRGGNALLYSEMENTIKEFSFKHAVLVLVAESAEDMRSDLDNIGGKPYTNHRVYHKNL
jgi:hypothetical protein